MKRLSTKSISSMLVATATVIGDVGKLAAERHFERMLRKHDRKGELRADLLGMTPLEFRDAVKKRSFDELLKAHGFKGRYEFTVALRGRLRDELLHRGWSRQRVNACMERSVVTTS